MEKMIAFDLETIARPGIVNLLPPVEPKKNLTDPAKIKSDIIEKETKRLSELGASPQTNMICLFAWANDDGYGCFPLADETAESEKNLLFFIWEKLSEYEQFITFNGMQFDVPCLKLHSLIRRVRPSVNISTKKYDQNSNHIDLRNILTGGGTFAQGKFDFWLKLIFGDDKGKTDGIDGSMVQDLWDEGDFETIANYGMKDAVLTWELWKQVNEYYLI